MTQRISDQAHPRGIWLLVLLALLGISLFSPWPALAAQPALEIQALPSGFSLKLSGEPGQDFLLESSSTETGIGGWDSMLLFTLPESSFNWFDSEASRSPSKFYRLIQLDEPAAAEEAENFRLLDHQGISRELHYQSDARAIVLIFTTIDCAELSRNSEIISALRARFESQEVRFWLVSSGPAETRSHLTTHASNLGVDLPILHDSVQLVAREFHATTCPEAIAIDPRDWTIFYRGAIEAAGPASASPQSYLADALTAFLADQLIIFRQTPGSGSPISIIPDSEPSYAETIAPILINRCVDCHSPGNIAPWAMTNHAILQSYAHSMEHEILEGHMPPWHADPEFGVFSNDSSLRPQEATALMEWLDAGAPRGDGPDPLENLFKTNAPTVDYPYAWPASLGLPDHIVKATNYTIRATGEVPYQYFEVKLNLPTDVWLRAAVVLPGNLQVVHHSLLFIGNRLDVFLNNGGGLLGFFSGYVPGMKAVSYPPQTGKFLKKDATLTFQMHYTTTGKSETDQTSLGLYFLPAPPALELKTGSAFNIDISIAPHQNGYARQAEFIPSATKDIWLYEMSPHMHYRGASFKYEAIYPAGGSEVLLSVPHYEFHWQSLYRLAEPKRLPAGTIIRCSGTFDNSERNPHNPNPAAQVRFGEQTDDEMFIGYLNYAEIP